MNLDSNVYSSFLRGKAISERERRFEKLNILVADNEKTSCMGLSRLTKGLYGAQESL